MAVKRIINKKVEVKETPMIEEEVIVKEKVETKKPVTKKEVKVAKEKEVKVTKPIAKEKEEEVKVTKPVTNRNSIESIMSAKKTKKEDKSRNSNQLLRDEAIQLIKDKLEEKYKCDTSLIFAENMLKIVEEVIKEEVIDKGQSFNLAGKLIKRRPIKARVFKVSLEGVDYQTFKSPHMKLSWSAEVGDPEILKGEYDEETGIFTSEDNKEFNVSEINENFLKENSINQSTTED